MKPTPLSALALAHLLAAAALGAATWTLDNMPPTNRVYTAAETDAAIGGAVAAATNALGTAARADAGAFATNGNYQAAIPDLADIRAGAALGATAVQTLPDETDPVALPALAAAATAATNYTDAAATAATNYTDAAVAAAASAATNYTDRAFTNLAARPVALLPGQTDIDAHGDAHNGPVEIGEGAAATVDTSAVDTNTPIRSVSVAIGAGADARDTAHPEKQQAVAIGNQARASGVNALAIGAGVRHVDEDDMSGGNAYASGAQAVALGYAAKAVGNSAIQIGPGTNATPNSLQVLDTPLMRGGKLVVPEADIARAATNAVETMMGGKVAVLEQPPPSNGMARVSLSAYDSANDTDHALLIEVNTNDTVVAATMRVGGGPRLDIYKASSVDRLLLEQKHDAADVTNGVFAAARIPDLDAAKIASGVFAAARIPDLDAAKITNGVFAAARIPDLDAAKIASGVLDAARLPPPSPLWRYDAALDTAILVGARSSAPTNFGEAAVAIGFDSFAGGTDGAVALGAGARATKDWALALGSDTEATNQYSVVLATNGGHSHGDYTITLGNRLTTPELVYIGDTNLAQIVAALAPPPAAPSWTSLSLGANPTTNLACAANVNFDLSGSGTLSLSAVTGLTAAPTYVVARGFDALALPPGFASVGGAFRAGGHENHFALWATPSTNIVNFLFALP